MDPSSTPSSAMQKLIQEFQESCNALLQTFKDNGSTWSSIQDSNEEESLMQEQEDILSCILSNLEEFFDSTGQGSLRCLFSPCQVGETGWAIDPRKFASCLLMLTSHRSRLDDIPICKEEEEGDDDESNDNPYTITPLSLNAAKIYLELCQLKGAWSMGWMDECLLRNVEALLRRWGEESRGKKIAFLLEDKGGYKKKMIVKKKKKKKNTNDDDDYDQDGVDEYDGKGQYLGGHHDSVMMLGGLELSKSLTKILRCHEFWSWSKDVRDALMDAAVCALGYSSSLIGDSNVLHDNNKDDVNDKSIAVDEDDNEVNDDYDYDQCHRKRGLGHSKVNAIDATDFGYHVVNALISAIENCVKKKLFHLAQQQQSQKMKHDGNSKNVSPDTTVENLSLFSPSLADNIINSSSYSVAEHDNDIHDMLVTFLRAIYPILTYQVDLPNGVKGKTSAYHHSSGLLTRLLKCAVKHCNKMNSIINSFDRVIMATTPAKSPNLTSNLSWKSPYSTSRKTPRSHNKHVVDGLQIIPPSLKKKAMTPRSIRRQSMGKDDDRSEALQAPNGSKSSSILGVFIGLLQKLSTYKGTDKVEFRTRTVNLIKICLSALPTTERNIFFRFSVKLCISKVLYHRVFGVELIGACFLMDHLWINKMQSLVPDTCPDHDDQNTSSEFARPDGTLSSFNPRPVGDEILSTLVGRLNDRAPAVRTRAASALSSALNSVHALDHSLIKCSMMKCISNMRLELSRLLRIRATTDEKASVRRSAILTLVDLIMADDAPCSKDDLAVLKDGCNDVSVSVRKSSIDCILSLLDCSQKTCTKEKQQNLLSLEKSWVDIVLPLIYDTENSVATKVADSFLQIVIDPILEGTDEIEDVILSMKSCSAWRILSRLNIPSSSGSGGQKHLTEVLRKSLELINVSDQKNIRVAIFRNVHHYITRELQIMNCDSLESLSDSFIGSWCLFEGISFFYATPSMKSTESSWDIRKDMKSSRIGTKFLVDSWNAIYTIGQNRNVSEKPEYIASAKSCLSVISSMSVIMTNDEASDLLQALRSSHVSFNLGIPLIGPSISAMVRISERLNDCDITSTQGFCYDWINECLGQCENALGEFFTNEYCASESIELALYTIGEVMLVGFSSSEENNRQNSSSSLLSKMKPTHNILRLVQSLLLPKLPSIDGKKDQRVIPQRIRAHAFISFGKMCLNDESLARTSINIFARELRHDKEYNAPAVKINALTILGDFCIRYTNLVDKFVPLMASCLQPTDKLPSMQDSESILRRHAVIILSNLILQDYIKWKGVLFYRFLAATVDEDPQVANQAKMMLCGPLLSKQPSLFFSNFIDAMFILNGCTAHPLYQNRNNRDKSVNADGLDFCHITDTTKREEIYSLLIDYLSDEEKIGVTARLSKEILSAATEMQGELRYAANKSSEENLTREGGEAFSVLSDCFQILISPKMQIFRSFSSSLSSDEDEVDYSTNVSTITNIQDTDGPSASQLSSAKGKLLSKISRKHLIEIVLPIVCNLKVILEKSRSPLLKNLMQYLVYIFRQFKKEVNETLASNPTLLQEIHYDTKRFEKNQRIDAHSSQSLVGVAVT